MKEIRFPAPAGLACSCFRSGEPINIPDAYAEPRFNQEVDRLTGYRTRNLLCMPVVNKAGTAIGVTQVLNKRGGPFEASDESPTQGLLGPGGDLHRERQVVRGRAERTQLQ